MAEVFLAVQESIGGFEKLVVVKRIFPQFCADAHFVSMFLQEARLAASIRHPNIVQIIDIEQDEEGYYLVMEYLSGESLAYVWEAMRTRELKIPPNVVCRIGASVAAGLHHAHIATDAAGKPQPIVHRDVTPSNLIVGYNGVCKVVDFGVAKATLSEDQTKAGSLKGKMSYLTPEQIRDVAIDGRTDVFQLGICLHEMLTGRRLFKGKTDHQRMTAVMEKEILPPSQFNPRVPRVLDEVVLKALYREPAGRFQTAAELRKALEMALVELGAAVSEAEVGDWMRSSFSDRYNERLALERECVSQVREGRPRDSTASELVMITDSSSRARVQRTPTLATAYENHSQSTVGSVVTGRRIGWWAAGIAAIVALVSIVAWQAGSGSNQAPAVAAADGNSELAAAAGELGKSVEPTGGPVNEHEDLTPPGEGEDADKNEAEEAPEEPPGLLITVTTVPESAEIYLDGERVGIGYFEREMRLSSSERHKVRIVAPGHISYEDTFRDRPPAKVIRLAKIRRTARADEDETDPSPASGDPGESGSGDGEPAATGEKPEPAVIVDATPIKTSGRPRRDRDTRKKPTERKTKNRDPFSKTKKTDLKDPFGRDR